MQVQESKGGWSKNVSKDARNDRYWNKTLSTTYRERKNRKKMLFVFKIKNSSALTFSPDCMNTLWRTNDKGYWWNWLWQRCQCGCKFFRTANWEKMFAMKIIMFWICAKTFNPDCHEKDVNVINGIRIGILCCPDGNYLFQNEKTARTEWFTGCNDHSLQAEEKKHLRKKRWSI